MTSTRYEGDTWDLASSVGATATMVAAARAVATRADRPLINDPYAEPLVRAVGVDLLTRLATGEVDPNDLNDVHDGATGSAGAMSRMADNMAVRTKFFDEFFLDATKAGIKQVVILASGLDSRAYRLRWPAGTVVYEVDQPQVIEFKTRTLAELGAAPTAEPGWWPSTCATTGPPPCAPPDSTRPSRAPGAPRASSATCLRTRRTACWTPSPNSAHRAAGSPPKARPTCRPATRTR